MLRITRWAILLLMLSTGPLWADDPVHAVDYSIKQFIKELREDISTKTKQHYLQIKSFAGTVSNAIPIGKWLKKGSWELDLMSHKMQLDKPTLATDHVEDNVGMALMTINRTWNINNFTYRIGVGTVSAYQGLYNDQFFQESDNGLLPTFAQDQFSVGGIASQGSVYTRIHLNRDVYLSVAGKLIYANGATSTSGFDINQRSVHLVFGIDGLF